MRDKIKEEIERGSDSAPCLCGGYADIIENGPTEEEIEEYDCGRGYACCTVAYKCRICGKEFIARQKAPEFI